MNSDHCITQTASVRSIRFPLVNERTGARRGPRYRRMPDKIGLHGAALCAASMIRAAVVMRDGAAREPGSSYGAYCRVSMRQKALWARVFAGQIRDDDARLAEAAEQSARLVTCFNRAVAA